MASRDAKYGKGFSKRLLSSFRKGKKSSALEGKTLLKEAQEIVGVHETETANIENAVGPEVEPTVQLQSPNKNGNVKSNDAPVTPKRNLRHLSGIDSGISSLSSTPRAPRFELGGTMSASTDSGIDCSILMSEKSSPEQFVAFTRREAERLRQEQLMNGSMLETLTEVDRSLSDSDSEKVVNDNITTNNAEKVINDDKTTKKGDNSKVDSELNDRSDIANETLRANKGEIDKPMCSDENMIQSSGKSGRVDGDYVLLTGEGNTNATPIVDVTQVVKANNSLQKEIVIESKSDISGAEITELPSGKTTSSHKKEQGLPARSVEDCYMLYYANRTDETKSAEAKLRSEDSVSTIPLLLNTTHDIVNPIAVLSSADSSHPVLPSTSATNQTHHLVNENSAFAKCKSIKRSVSKGFFDKLRHHKDCSDQSLSQDQSHVEEKSFSLKKSAFSKLKKLGVKKHKSSSRKRHQSDQAIKLFNHMDVGNLLMEEDELTEGNPRRKNKTKSPIVKEIVHGDSVDMSFIEHGKVNDNDLDVSMAIKSPVYKEVLTESVRNELEASIQQRRSPVGQDTTIEELTSSISRMTSALCASSAESIACICDCKNRLSDPECCDKHDKKKSPSPPCFIVDCAENSNECDQTKVSKNLRRTPSPQMFSGCIEVSCTPEVSRIENNTHSLSQSKSMNNSSFVLSDKVSEQSPCHEASSSQCQEFKSDKKFDSKTLNQSTNSKLNSHEYSSKNLNQSSKRKLDSNEYLCKDFNRSMDSCDDDSCAESCDCDDSTCSCEECTDIDDVDCSNCCNVSPNTANIDLLSSSSDSESDCSVGGSYEDLVTGTRTFKDKKVKGSRSSDSVSHSSLCVTPDKSSTANIEKGDSPFSVSFHEVVCENGDVMYVENSEFVKTYWNDDDAQTSPSTSASPGSPPVKQDQSVAVRQSTLNQSISRESMLNQSISEQSTLNQSISGQSMLNQSINRQSTLKQSIIEQSSLNQSISRQSTFNQSISEHSTLNQSISRQSTLNQSVCGQSTLNQSISRRPDSRRKPKIRNRTEPRAMSSPNLQRSNHGADSSFTNVSFEGSFADASFTVRNRPDERLRESSVYSSQESSRLDQNTRTKSRNRKRAPTSINESCSEEMNSSYVGEMSMNCSYLEKFHQNRLLSGLNDSQFLNLGRINPNRNLNDSVALNLSKRGKSLHSACDLNSSASFVGATELNVDPRLNRSMPFMTSPNKPFNRHTKLNRSFHGTSPASSPLDLSMSRQRSPPKSRTSGADDNWVERHCGQVYSPAKRVLHKNRGLSENDLCKQILDLYVSDADESGFEAPDLDGTLNGSSFLNASADSSRVSERSVKSVLRESGTGELSGSEGEQSCLQYGTYVAPRNVVKETNVDDFTTTTVWTCYSGEARTRRLQGRGDNSIRAEDRRRAAYKELNHSSLSKKRYRRKKDNSVNEDSFSDSSSVLSERSALSDRTNTTPRLSQLEMPTSLDASLNESVCSTGGEELDDAEEVEHVEEPRLDPRKLNEKGFDQLTMMHTVRNGRRKVRCLSMDESQSVVKCYPPPKEASRISWGQTISEMDLYRHSPRKTPVKTRPILAQKENNYPYEDDTPSPIVLTRMRRPKSLAKKYKNWPWS